MNKAHHGRRQEIRAADVAQCANDLSELSNLSSRCTRSATVGGAGTRPRIRPRPGTGRADAHGPSPVLNILVCPDLAAFTQHAPGRESAGISRTSRSSSSRQRGRLLSAATEFRICCAVAHLPSSKPCQVLQRTGGSSLPGTEAPCTRAALCVVRMRASLASLRKSRIPGQEPQRRSSSLRPRSQSTKSSESFLTTLSRLRPGQEEAVRSMRAMC